MGKYNEVTRQIIDIIDETDEVDAAGWGEVHDFLFLTFIHTYYLAS